MMTIGALEARLGEILEALDGAAGGDEDILELNAEFEDALFALSALDPEDGDFDEDFEDCLEEFRALRDGYAGYPALAGAVERLDGVLSTARGEA